MDLVNVGETAFGEILLDDTVVGADFELCARVEFPELVHGDGVKQGRVYRYWTAAAIRNWDGCRQKGIVVWWVAMEV